MSQWKERSLLLLNATIMMGAVACLQPLVFIEHTDKAAGADSDVTDDNAGNRMERTNANDETSEVHRDKPGTDKLSPQCAEPGDCPGEDSACAERTCERGVCGVAMQETGMPCGDADTKFCDDAGLCLAPFDLGESCVVALQCDSGFCIDGVCCNQGCSKLCVACHGVDTISGEAGVCSPVMNGSDPNDHCPGEMVCNGVAGCY